MIPGGLDILIHSAGVAMVNSEDTADGIEVSYQGFHEKINSFSYSSILENSNLIRKNKKIHYDQILKNYIIKMIFSECPWTVFIN